MPPVPYPPSACAPVSAPAGPPPVPDRPFDVQALPVGGGHVLHVEQWGRPDGVPALLLHGGPGSGQSPVLRRGFDLAHWRVIAFDQRGAGRSQPAGSTIDNTTGHLVDDIRRLRARLGITRWLVVGGSWGATLALAHAIDAPDAVAGLLLRSAFTAGQAEVQAFFTADEGRPWRALAALLENADPAGWPAAVAQRLADPATPPALQRALVQAWHDAEVMLEGGRPAPLGDDAFVPRLQRLRILAHYLAHGCWLQRPELPERCAAMPARPTLLLHGREDRICPPAGALALQAGLPHARLRWIDGAGHDPPPPAMAGAMRQALDGWLAHGAEAWA